MMDARLARLNAVLDTFPTVLIAYSGGVDSACLLCAAHRRLGRRALGVIADSPSLPRAELAAAIRLAHDMGAPLEVVQSREFDDPNFVANPTDRCYFCKHALFREMKRIATEQGFTVLAYGENADDEAEWRPGARAAAEFQVRIPLREAGLTKADVRDLSAQWGLPTAEKPSSPCLSSRIPHGTPVTVQALARVESGEAAIRALGFRVFRLRHHESRARIEFALDEIERAQGEPWRSRVIQAALAAGYGEVEIDPRGYRGAGVAGRDSLTARRS